MRGNAGSTAQARRWPPLTVTREALLANGSDERFRALIDDLLVMAHQLQALRLTLARGLGLSEPQYRLFLAIAQHEGSAGVSVGRVARHLRVSGAFATMETRELVRRGLVGKSSDPSDGRAVLLSLTAKGRSSFERFARQPQRINDALFRGLSAAEFRALGGLVRRLVVNGERALAIGEARGAAATSRARRAASFPRKREPARGERMEAAGGRRLRRV